MLQEPARCATAHPLGRARRPLRSRSLLVALEFHEDRTMSAAFRLKRADAKSEAQPEHFVLVCVAWWARSRRAHLDRGAKLHRTTRLAGPQDRRCPTAHSHPPLHARPHSDRTRMSGLIEPCEGPATKKRPTMEVPIVPQRASHGSWGNRQRSTVRPFGMRAWSISAPSPSHRTLEPPDSGVRSSTCESGNATISSFVQSSAPDGTLSRLPC